MQERKGAFHIILRVPCSRKDQVGEILKKRAPALQILVGGDVPPVVLPGP
jgi:hypothetical protein